jgi:hypothetical protein
VNIKLCVQFQETCRGFLAFFRDFRFSSGFYCKLVPLIMGVERGEYKHVMGVMGLSVEGCSGSLQS